jgi:type IV secretion system protein VirD4
VPVALMIVIVFGMMSGSSTGSTFGKTEAARLTLGRVGIALPYIAAATGGVVFLFACAGSPNIKFAGAGVAAGSAATIVIALAGGIASDGDRRPDAGRGQSLLSFLDPATTIGAGAAAMSAVFGLRVAEGQRGVRDGRAAAHSRQARAAW